MDRTVFPGNQQALFSALMLSVTWCLEPAPSVPTSKSITINGNVVLPETPPAMFMLDGLIELRGRILLLAEYSPTRCKCLRLIQLGKDGSEISNKGRLGILHKRRSPQHESLMLPAGPAIDFASHLGTKLIVIPEAARGFPPCFHVP